MLAFHKENTVLRKNKSQWILSTTMFSSLVNINSFVSDVYMDNKDDIIC